MKMMIGRPCSGLFVVISFFSQLAIAAIPPCLGGGQILAVDDARVLQLKKTSPLGVPVRAHVRGTVTRVFPDKNGHAHFEIKLGDTTSDLLEVVYSEDFGDLPTPSIGAQVEACGDFINSYGPNGGYDASPSGAIIHWVHRSDSPKHDSGYVQLDNVIYGYGKDQNPHHHLQ